MLRSLNNRTLKNWKYISKNQSSIIKKYKKLFKGNKRAFCFQVSAQQSLLKAFGDFINEVILTIEKGEKILVIIDQQISDDELSIVESQYERLNLINSEITTVMEVSYKSSLWFFIKNDGNKVIDVLNEGGFRSTSSAEIRLDIMQHWELLEYSDRI